jgi:hypothetical protein
MSKEAVFKEQSYESVFERSSLVGVLRVSLKK